jgi:hypothetical protein
MATEKWIAGSGVGLVWATAFTTPPGAIVNGNAIMSDLVIDNSTNLDMYADLSIHLGSAAFVAPNYIGVYLYPLNYGAPGTVYGDGRFGTSAAGPPPAQYYVGSIVLVAATQAQDGELRGILLPPGKFSFVLYNQGGVTLNATNVCQYRTYNRSVA